MTESTIHDVGYASYEGERLPPSHAFFTMFRFAMRRIWSSGLVKFAVFTGWIPTIVAIAIVGFRFWVMSSGFGESFGSDQAAQWIGLLLHIQLWFAVSLACLGGGAGVISGDLNRRAFPFFFSKPVTPLHYLVGHMTAMIVWCLILTIVPALFLYLSLLGTATGATRLDVLVLIIPLVASASFIAIACGILSVAVSSLNTSRTFTMATWIVLFVVPWLLASLVASVADWPWLQLLSFPSLLAVTTEGLFGVDIQNDVRFFHAIPIVILACAASAFWAYRRLMNAEIIK